ncbi:uncharacterized protein LAJ45_09368 [Morchella importuna]|uniref:uncharacterized protein n=1 Tax=Morchella importuna TaxID=1174673 RepID=UPI001E8E6184|nr:uncharacterized protein LAJ45_09368 [Morchella importuna]KAH8146685.1 hypothetical protein LAJ45_09368 [Morchella importuna]
MTSGSSSPPMRTLLRSDSFARPMCVWAAVTPSVAAEMRSGRSTMLARSALVVLGREYLWRAGSGVATESDRSDIMLERRPRLVLLLGTSGEVSVEGEVPSEVSEVIEGRFLMLGVEGALERVLRGWVSGSGDEVVESRPEPAL